MVSTSALPSSPSDCCSLLCGEIFALPGLPCGELPALDRTTALGDAPVVFFAISGSSRKRLLRDDFWLTVGTKSFSHAGHHFEIDVRLNEVQGGPQTGDNLWPEHPVGVVKETVWQPKRRFHMKGRFGRESFALHQLGHALKAGFKP
jgi:hypothetical protein